MKRIASDRIVADDRLLSGFVYLDEAGKIVEVSERDLPVTETYDARGLYVAPGFIDLHTHGGGGNHFEGTLDEVVAGCNFHLAHGTTSIYPTLSAAPLSRMAESVEIIAQAQKDPRLLSNLLGVHMEGPYLSRQQAGAQCADFITPPVEADYLPLLEKHADVIRRWSYAPENDEGEKFARAMREYGVVSSAGHSDAIYDDLLRAKRQGCNLVTHLYSCTSTITRDHGFRRLGVIETAFLDREMFVEIICDGKHLPPELIRLIYQIKGPDHIALVTDSLALAGTTQTKGHTQNTQFLIEDGVCKLPDRSAFAGSIATTDRLIRVAVKEAGLPLLDAVKMMTKTPATVMGLPKKGELAPGFDADVTVFDEDINVKAVFVAGKKVI